MAKKTNRQYAEALYEITEGLEGENLDKALHGFVTILVKDHKLKQADNILREFIKVEKEGQGIKEIEIISANELDNDIIKKIKQVFGEKVEESTKIDESILGGIKVKTGDKILDASLKTQLKRLKAKLI